MFRMCAIVKIIATFNFEFFSYNHSYLDERLCKANERSSPSIDNQSDLIPTPTVTIMVESPKDPPPNAEHFGLADISIPIIQPVQLVQSESDIISCSQSESTIIQIEEPIDVNLPRDTSNIFYDYTGPEQPAEYDQESSSPLVPSSDCTNTSTIQIDDRAELMQYDDDDEDDHHQHSS